MNTLVDVYQKRTKVFFYLNRRYMWLGVSRRWPLDHIVSAQGLASLHQKKLNSGTRGLTDVTVFPASLTPV
jgi:hypothetical protein